MTGGGTGPRVRRAPPPFRRATVRRVERVTPRLARVALGGDELDGFALREPAASVRLLLPTTAGLVMPQWNGNEFLLPDGGRPTIRTFTPLRPRGEATGIDLEVVLHAGGAASSWAATVAPGAPAALSGPGRGYAVDATATAFLVAGDETALPAIGQLLEQLPGAARVEVHVEVADPAARLVLASRPGLTVSWHHLPADAEPGATLVEAVAAAELGGGTRVWAAGEAAAMQRIRKHLFEERGVPRRDATVRGYWKQGRAGDGGED